MFMQPENSQDNGDKVFACLSHKDDFELEFDVL